jgi:superfamily II DNA or RNA helicase
MDLSNDKTIIEAKIKKIDEEIALLSTLRQNLIDKLSVQNSIKSQVAPDPPIKEFTPEEKINLFRCYFRGRDDVYARLWINDRTSKKGYSPACKHEWDRRLCRKPKVKCSECQNQKFYSVDNDATRKHLTGSQVIGIYPMLKNEACYFLAIDLDKENWLEDINALKTTCDEENIPAVVERSRSGSGGHLWIFFTEEIPASIARMFGSHIITKTMGKRYQMNMKSYDRLFPNQDTLPKGGFGNLIALPFQKKAVLKGNSVFIDDKGTPYPNQWNFLTSTRKMTLSEVQQIVDTAVKNDQLINVRQSQIAENDGPWMRIPSRKLRFKAEIKNLPISIELVLANRIYLKTDVMPAMLLNQLKHLAAFQNPEFYKKQKMRFSTHDTPRVICCAEIEDGYLSLPRGCLSDVEKLLNEYGVKVAMQDKRYEGQERSFDFLGTLSDEQNESLKNILSSDVGVFVAPPGSGKTVLAVAAIAERKRNVLILVHRKPLMDQWRLQLSSLLGIDKKEIGQIGGGKNKSNGIIDVAMVQSLDNENGVDNRIADYGFVIVDECHHVSAVSFEKVLTQAKAKYVLGLTATPYRRDGHQPIIHMQCGPICYQIKQKELPSHLSGSSVVARESNFTYEWNNDSKIQDLLLKLVSDEGRNQMIVDDVTQALSEGRFPLILTERREHLERLAELLKDKADFIALLCGGLRKKATREIFQQLKESPDNIRKVILATGSYIGEGFDEPRLDTLFLTMPSSFKGKIVQYAGRLHRYHKDKNEVRIYDYVDKNVLVLEKMFQKRVKTYKMLGYSIDRK